MAPRGKYQPRRDPEFQPGVASLGPQYSDYTWVDAKKNNKNATLLGRHPVLVLLIASGLLISQGQFENCWFVAPLTNRSRDQQFLSTVLGPAPFANSRRGFWRLRLRVDLRWQWYDIDSNLPYDEDEWAGVAPVGDIHLWSAIEKTFAKILGSYTRMSGGLYNEGLSVLFDGYGFDFRVEDLSLEALARLLLNGLARGCKFGVGTKALRYGETPEVIPDLQDGHSFDLRGVVWGKVAGRLRLYLILRDPNRGPLKGSIHSSSPLWKSVEPRLKRELETHLAEEGTLAVSFEDLQARALRIHQMKPLPPVEEHFVDGPHQFVYQNRQGVFWTKTVQVERGEPKETLTVTPPPDFAYPSTLITIASQQARRREGERYIRMGLDLFKARAAPTIKGRKNKWRRLLVSAEKNWRSEKALDFVIKAHSAFEVVPTFDERAGGTVDLFAFVLEGVEEEVDSPDLVKFLAELEKESDDAPTAKRRRTSP